MSKYPPVNQDLLFSWLDSEIKRSRDSLITCLERTRSDYEQRIEELKAGEPMNPSGIWMRDFEEKKARLNTLLDVKNLITPTDKK